MEYENDSNGFNLRDFLGQAVDVYGSYLNARNAGASTASTLSQQNLAAQQAAAAQAQASANNAMLIKGLVIGGIVLAVGLVAWLILRRK